MRKAYFAQELDIGPLAETHGRGCPLPDAVHRQNGCFFKRRTEKVLAAWDRWCSLNKICDGRTPKRFCSRLLIHSLSANQEIMASRNSRCYRGNVFMVVSRR